VTHCFGASDICLALAEPAECGSPLVVVDSQHWVMRHGSVAFASVSVIQ